MTRHIPDNLIDTTQQEIGVPANLELPSNANIQSSAYTYFLLIALASSSGATESFWIKVTHVEADEADQDEPIFSGVVDNDLCLFSEAYPRGAAISCRKEHILQVLRIPLDTSALSSSLT